MPDQNPGGFVATDKTETGTNTVIVTETGANSYPCPGGLTADDLVK